MKKLLGLLLFVVACEGPRPQDELLWCGEWDPATPHRDTATVDCHAQDWDGKNCLLCNLADESALSCALNDQLKCVQDCSTCPFPDSTTP